MQSCNVTLILTSDPEHYIKVLLLTYNQAEGDDDEEDLHSEPRLTHFTSENNNKTLL